MKRLLTSILALTAIISCLGFSSCKDENTTESGLSIVENQKSEYVIYRADLAKEGEQEGGAKLRTLIKDATGVRLEYATDDKFGKIEGMKEIVIGNTNRDASKIAAEGLGDNQFRFLVVGDTLAIAASNPDCLTAAAETFAKEYVTKDSVKVPLKLDRTWQCTEGFGSYEVKNPINPTGHDPYVIDKDGKYYYCWSGGGGVMVSAADSLAETSRDGGTVVFKAPAGTMYSSEYWAPELHYVQGEWYIYVAADDGEDKNHRMFVLKGTTQNPLDPFEFVGQIKDPSDMWAIDGTVLKVKDELYFVWSGWENEGDFGIQRLYISHMSNPYTIDSERVLLSRPDYGWEGSLNEGPIPVYKDGEIYLIFSANGSWTGNYCLGYMRLDGDDPMKPSDWYKNSSPILSRNAVAKGPGHCSVVNAIDGSYWIIYHANLPSAPDGGDGRSVWIQELQFGKNKTIKIMKNEKVVDYPKKAWLVEKEITE